MLLQVEILRQVSTLDLDLSIPFLTSHQGTLNQAATHWALTHQLHILDMTHQ